MSNSVGINIGVVGATGQVGAVVRRLLEERDFPVGEHPLLRVGALRRNDAAVARRGHRRRGRLDRRPDRARHRDLLGRRHDCRRRRLRASPRPACIVIDNSSRLAHGPRRAARRERGQPARHRPMPQGHHRQPELHDDGGHARAEGAARRGRPRAPHREHLPGRVRVPVSPVPRSCSSRRAPPSAGRRARPRARRPRRRAPGAEQVRPHDRVRRHPARRLHRRRRRLSRPTRRRSCATRAARSSSCPDLLVSGTCVRVPVFTGHSLVDQRRVRQPHHASSAPRSCSPTPPASC